MTRSFLIAIVEAQAAASRAALYGLLAVQYALAEFVVLACHDAAAQRRVALPPDVADLDAERARRLGGGCRRG